MMKIKTIASGSTGNCHIVSENGVSIMIECGIVFREIQKGLNFKLHEIDACLVSHGHKDHCLAIKEIMKSGIDIYATKETFQAVNAFGHRVNMIEATREFEVERWKIYPFETAHDCEGCVGFIIRTPAGSKVLFATDTRYVPFKFGLKFTHIMIEANFKQAILDKNIENGRVPALIKKRVMGSHFEIDNVKKFLTNHDLSDCEEIHLIHLSKENGDPKLFKKEIERLTGVPTYV